MKANAGGCFYCGQKGYFVLECEEMKLDDEAGMVKLDSKGIVRLANGSHILNMHDVSTIKEKMERYYAEEQCQYLAREDDNDNVLYVATLKPSSQSSYSAQYFYTTKDSVHQEARLRYVLDLEEREEALVLREEMIEEDRRKEAMHTLLRNWKSLPRKR